MEERGTDSAYRWLALPWIVVTTNRSVGALAVARAVLRALDRARSVPGRPLPERVRGRRPVQAQVHPVAAHLVHVFERKA